MKKLAFLMAASVGVSLLSSVAAADLIYANSWDGTGNAYSSQNDTAPGGFGNYATVYDSFTFTGPTVVNEIAWVGEYFNGPDGAISSFTLSFYLDDGTGAPGAFAGSIATGNNANETFIGNAGGFDTFLYDASGFTVSGGPGTYWMSVVADTPFPPQWGWSSSADGGGQAYQDFFGARGGLGTNMAFAMFGTTTPEPASMAALGLGVVALIRRRKNAKA